MEGERPEPESRVGSRLSRRSKQWRASINFSAIVSPSRPTEEYQTGPSPHLPPGHPLHSVRNRDSMLLTAQPQQQPTTTTTTTATGLPPLSIATGPNPATPAETQAREPAAAPTETPSKRDSEALKGADAAGPPSPPLSPPSSHRASYHHPIPGIYDRAALLFPRRRSLDPVSGSQAAAAATLGKFPVGSTVSEDEDEDDDDDDDERDGLRAEKSAAALGSSVNAGEGRASKRHGGRLRRWLDRGFAKGR